MLKNDAPPWLIDMVAKVIHDAEGMGNTVWPLNPESSSFFLTEEEKNLYHKATKDVLEAISFLEILDASLVYYLANDIQTAIPSAAQRLMERGVMQWKE